jgi:hypothetical protein
VFLPGQYWIPHVFRAESLLLTGQHLSGVGRNDKNAAISEEEDDGVSACWTWLNSQALA